MAAAAARADRFSPAQPSTQRSMSFDHLWVGFFADQSEYDKIKPYFELAHPKGFEPLASAFGGKNGGFTLRSAGAR
jgi:hypothetical protein